MFPFNHSRSTPVLIQVLILQQFFIFLYFHNHSIIFFPNSFPDLHFNLISSIFSNAPIKPSILFPSFYNSLNLPRCIFSATCNFLQISDLHWFPRENWNVANTASLITDKRLNYEIDGLIKMIR